MVEVVDGVNLEEVGLAYSLAESLTRRAVRQVHMQARKVAAAAAM